MARVLAVGLPASLRDKGKTTETSNRYPLFEVSYMSTYFFCLPRYPLCNITTPGGQVGRVPGGRPRRGTRPDDARHEGTGVPSDRRVYGPGGADCAHDPKDVGQDAQGVRHCPRGEC